MARKGGKDKGLFPWPGLKNVWGIRWVENGRDRKRKIGNKEQAKEALVQVRAQLLRSDGLLPPERRKTLCLEEVIQSHLRVIKGTSRDWQHQEYFGRLWSEEFPSTPLSRVTPQDLEEWRAERLDDGAAPATVNRALSFLRKIFNVAIKNGDIASNPVSKVKMLRENNTRERYLTPDEEVRLLAAVSPARYRDHIQLAIGTGLRQSEMLNLRWTDVEFVHNQIRIPRSKHGEARRVPMSPEVREILERWHAATERHPTYVIPDSTGERAMPRTGGMRVAYNKAVAKAGIENLNWHDLRHTFASRLVMAGVDLYTVQLLMGHKSHTTTQRYAHLAPDHLQAAVNKLPRISANGTGVVPVDVSHLAARAEAELPADFTNGAFRGTEVPVRLN